MSNLTVNNILPSNNIHTRKYCHNGKINIVAYRPIAGQGPQANNGMAALSLQWCSKHASTTIQLLLDEHVLCRGVIKRRELGQPLSSSREAERRWRYS
jgi:hypothetical protein